MHEASITAIIITIIGLIGGYLTYTQSRRSNQRQEIGEAVLEWKDLYTGVASENARLKQEIAELHLDVDRLETAVSKIKQQVEQERTQWETERARLYRRLYRLEHNDDTTPPPKSRGT